MATFDPTLARVMQHVIDADDEDGLHALEDVLDAGAQVVKSWQHGDLSRAVSDLADALGILDPIQKGGE